MASRGHIPLHSVHCDQHFRPCWISIRWVAKFILCCVWCLQVLLPDTLHSSALFFQSIKLPVSVIAQLHSRQALVLSVCSSHRTSIPFSCSTRFYIFIWLSLFIHGLALIQHLYILSFPYYISSSPCNTLYAFYSHDLHPILTQSRFHISFLTAPLPLSQPNPFRCHIRVSHSHTPSPTYTSLPQYHTLLNQY